MHNYTENPSNISFPNVLGCLEHQEGRVIELKKDMHEKNTKGNKRPFSFILILNLTHLSKKIVDKGCENAHV